MNKSNKISVEGLELPNKALTNFELMDAVKDLQIPIFRGVFMRNNLPPRPQKRECGILNLDDVSSRGSHWVCWYKINNKKLYFDSFGVQPPRELIEYLGSPIYYNTERIQPDGEVICGHLCLYVLCRLSRGDRFQKIVNDLH